MDNQERRVHPVRHRKPCPNSVYPGDHSRVIGIIIILIGIAFLLKTIPSTSALLPQWLFTWPVILIIAGIFTGFKHRFKRLGWLIPTLIGLFFLIRNQFVLSEYLEKLLFPLGIILIGIFILIKQKKRKAWLIHHREIRRFSQAAPEEDTENFINIHSSFGNIEKIVLSKKLKGGDIVCSFGGAQIDFTQSDIADKAVFNFSITAGGAEISVPSNWNIQNDINVILGGIEDKRKRFNHTEEDEKIIVLAGNITLGGLVIKN